MFKNKSNKYVRETQENLYLVELLLVFQFSYFVFETNTVPNVFCLGNFVLEVVSVRERVPKRVLASQATHWDHL